MYFADHNPPRFHAIYAEIAEIAPESATSHRISSRQYHECPPWSHSSSNSRRKPLPVRSKRDRGTRPPAGWLSVRNAIMASRPSAWRRHIGIVKSQNASSVKRSSAATPLSSKSISLAARARRSVTRSVATRSFGDGHWSLLGCVSRPGVDCLSLWRDPTRHSVNSTTRRDSPGYVAAEPHHRDVARFESSASQRSTSSG